MASDFPAVQYRPESAIAAVITRAATAMSQKQCSRGGTLFRRLRLPVPTTPISSSSRGTQSAAFQIILTRIDDVGDGRKKYNPITPYKKSTGQEKYAYTER